MAFFKRNAQKNTNDSLQTQTETPVINEVTVPEEPPVTAAPPRRSFFLKREPEPEQNLEPPFAVPDLQDFEPEFLPEPEHEPEPKPQPRKDAQDKPAADKSAFEPVMSFEEKKKRFDAVKSRVNELSAELETISGIFKSADKVSLGSRENKLGTGKAASTPAQEESSIKFTPVSRDARLPGKSARKHSKRPVSLAFADFRHDPTLRWDDIKDAYDIFGIKYPAQFDIENTNFTGRAIDYSDFSRVSSLRWKHIKDASDITGIVFPATFDIEAADFFNRSISGCDFSAVYALKWHHIEDASDITAIKYPPTFDISNAHFAGRSIMGSDFSLVENLKWEYIFRAADIRGIKYPAGFDIENADFAGRDISDSDFSLVNVLKWEHIAPAKSVRSIIYPAGFDINTADFSGRDISGSDFTAVKGLRWKHIKNAVKACGVKFPGEFDAKNADFSKLDISGANFSRVNSLRFAQIIKAKKLQKIIYPPKFDIDDADYTDRNIDFSDFSHLPGFNWNAVKYASGREGVVYPRGFVVPELSLDEIEGAMLIYLLELHGVIYGDKPDTGKFFSDVNALYPGIDGEQAALLLENANKVFNGKNGKKEIKAMAREAHVGDKLFLVKLGWRLIASERGENLAEKKIREILTPIFKDFEIERFKKRIEDLKNVKFLSASEQSAIKDRKHEPEESKPAKAPQKSEPVKTEKITDAPQEDTAAAPEAAPAKNIVTSIEDGEKTVEVKLPDFSPSSNVINVDAIVRSAHSGDAKKDLEPKKENEIDKTEKELTPDEIKAIRTGVMGMLLYIKRNASDEPLSFSELSTTFLQIYPDATIKDASAMAQFSSNVLNGVNTQMRNKLFAFAMRASDTSKRKLLEFAYEQYQYKLATLEDEESFKDFISALCQTLFDDSADYEYTEFLRKKEILKKADPTLKPRYKAVSFMPHIGKVNVYANENYPFYRTLEMVGFSHFTFEALSGSLLIEVGDNKFYDDTAHLVTREVEPNLLEFVVIDSQYGFLYLEQRTLSDWGIDAGSVWRAAEKNMENIIYKPRYVFSSIETTPYRYIQNDLAAYILFRIDILKKLSDGKDLVIGIPCREIAYIDRYSFDGVRAMLDLVSKYNCTVYVEDEPYEHPVTNDVFIFRSADFSIERVNDEDYIMLGDTETRRNILRSVAPQVDFSNFKPLLTPYRTDELPHLTEDEIVIQEAVYTVLKLYAYCNGVYDYTVAENALMAVFDDIYITFDAQYPAVSGRHHPDPMDHIPECATVVARAGKKVNWLLVQAFEKICGDAHYETPSAANIRQTVMNKVYGNNANVIWLSCGAAEDFIKRFEATARLHEKYVENAHLYFLDSEVEMVMHALTLIFHQFGKRYALGQVRRHILRIMPNISFTYEQSQSAWLPEQGANLDVEIQSLGMVLRGFEPKLKERILQGLADAIGDTDLAEAGWPLLVYTKLVKSAYLGPEEVITRCFASRSRMIPGSNVLKALNYKDVNAEFVKHSRAASMTAATSGQMFNLNVEIPEGPDLDIPDPMADQKENVTLRKPELCFAPLEPEYLRSELNFVIEPSRNELSQTLRQTAEFFSSVFHVHEMNFRANNDVEAELFNGILRRTEQFTTLRSMAWTCGDLIRQRGRDLTTITADEMRTAADYVVSQNRLAYRADEMFPALCGTPVNNGMFIPVQQEYLFFAQTQIPGIPLASLFSLQQELVALIPVMNIICDILRAARVGDELPPDDILSDTLRAWCALALNADHPLTITEGPSFYNFAHIKRS